MGRPLLLDLFCGAGGCSVGYHRAGFDVVGVDHKPQPRYPYRFILGDVFEVMENFGPTLADYSVIHASPPCQKFSIASRCRPGRQYRDLLTPTLRLLSSPATPCWVIENVIGAPLSRYSCKLCGLMFGLKVFRHRLFESSHLLLRPEHPSHRGIHVGVAGMVCVAGHGSTSRYNRIKTPPDHRNKASWVKAMGIDWMTRDELSQAIPPAYTEYIGKQLMRIIR